MLTAFGSEWQSSLVRRGLHRETSARPGQIHERLGPTSDPQPGAARRDVPQCPNGKIEVFVLVFVSIVRRSSLSRSCPFGENKPRLRFKRNSLVVHCLLHSKTPSLSISPKPLPLSGPGLIGPRRSSSIFAHFSNASASETRVWPPIRPVLPLLCGLCRRHREALTPSRPMMFPYSMPVSMRRPNTSRSVSRYLKTKREDGTVESWRI